MNFQAIKNIASLGRSFAAVKRTYGKSYLAQVLEVIALYRTAEQFGISDYFDLQLYRDDFSEGVRKSDFAGWKMEEWLDVRLNPSLWVGIATDKLILYSVLHAHGFEYARIKATYRTRHYRPFCDAITLCDHSGALAWLRSAGAFPTFVKPAAGSIGQGTWSLQGYDRASEQLELMNGHRIGTEEFLDELDRPKRWGVFVDNGYLFQETVEQHEAIKQIAGRAVSTIRFVVLAHKGAMQPFRAVWRVATGSNMTDNFVKGTAGNLLADIDLRSGKVRRVIGGVGLEQVQINEHPDTGERLVGFQLPHWKESVEVCLAAALLFPMFRFQHWDLAIGPDGPILMELNTGGSIEILQYASRIGLYDEVLREAISQASGP